MSHRKRTVSKIIQAAAARASGLESIDPMPDLGTDVTLTALKAAIVEGQNRINAYNTLLAEADEARNLVQASEEKVRQCSSRLLAAVAAKFGRDSNEYEMAGGTRTSDRRRRPSAQPTTSTPPGA